MTEKFVTPHPLPTPYEREVLIILIEECAEVQKRATKALRFGIDEIQPGQRHTNMERLSAEMGDLMAVVALAHKAGLLSNEIIDHYIGVKHEKLERFMQTTSD